ncbi:hypothetical protein TsFJ059_005920 [Trichoderma semiorbis]|uniref:Uncharacterized protein n=1 Tax=Trichoderma semiorbis TaxID=1491008 RepID=A0A9P8HBX6_9HYPO|nr:hypothetical protein TsFJ059_005920 [Trichoderma semiorbis]
MTRRCRIIVAPTRCAEMPQPPIGGPACGRGRERAACSEDMEGHGLVQARGKARPGQKGPAPCAWPALHPRTARVAPHVRSSARLELDVDGDAHGSKQ